MCDLTIWCAGHSYISAMNKRWFQYWAFKRINIITDEKEGKGNREKKGEGCNPNHTMVWTVIEEAHQVLSRKELLRQEAIWVKEILNPEK